tara:strand:- start:59 stop:943 length:885 start_codon:yes stop_codon:yes gene_type:complete
METKLRKNYLDHIKLINTRPSNCLVNPAVLEAVPSSEERFNGLNVDELFALVEIVKVEWERIQQFTIDLRRKETEREIQRVRARIREEKLNEHRNLEREKEKSKKDDKIKKAQEFTTLRLKTLVSKPVQEQFQQQREYQLEKKRQHLAARREAERNRRKKNEHDHRRKVNKQSPYEMDLYVYRKGYAELEMRGYTVPVRKNDGRRWVTYIDRKKITASSLPKIFAKAVAHRDEHTSWQKREFRGQPYRYARSSAPKVKCHDESTIDAASVSLGMGTKMLPSNRYGLKSQNIIPS